MPRKSNIPSVVLSTLLLLGFLVVSTEAGLYKMMSELWDDPWESKGITFGIKSKGMTAIIPIPLPIPIFSKDKKKDSGGDKGGDTGGWEAPADNGGGGGGWWR
ncbi:uncharacterized protein [Parasteatoda tepidariorum]|uniref:uncharacterized protein n=1 Tax=Parasteatoda tepidariorum TaxID=114398 RepID=UPI00077FDEEB